MNKPDVSGTHIEPGEMLAWIDGELSARRQDEVRRHVEGCPACAALHNELRDVSTSFQRAARACDVSSPVRSAAEVRRHGIRRRPIGSVAAAAILVLLFAGASLALVPGSPFRSWISDLHGRLSSTPNAPVAPFTVVTKLSAVSPDSVDVVLGEPRDSLEVDFVRSAGRHLEVATDARGVLGPLDLGNARLRIDPGSARVLRITFPRATHVRILLRGRDLLTSRRLLPSSGAKDSMSVIHVEPMSHVNDP